jgi:hypothetical protein
MQQSIQILDIQVNIPVPEEYKIYVKSFWNPKKQIHEEKSIFDDKFVYYSYLNSFDDRYLIKLKDGILGNRPEVDYYINNARYFCKINYRKNIINYTSMPLSKMRFGLSSKSNFKFEEFDLFLNCAIKSTTENEVLELINNNKITKVMFEKIEDKFEIIPLVKSKNGRKIIENLIYKIKSSFLVQKMIKEYNIDVKISLSKAITSKLPDIIYSLLMSLSSKVQRQEYYTKIIRILPDLLENPDCPIELINELESIEAIRWNCFGPEPGEFSDYYLKKNLKDFLLTKNAKSEIIEYVFEKIKPEIDTSDLKKYLALVLKTYDITNDFYETMNIFKKYAKEVELD